MWIRWLVRALRKPESIASYLVADYPACFTLLSINLKLQTQKSRLMGD
ncbi:hypothetical protein SAMN05661010_03344 [Modicisalibacter muralis]|uniref:Uncharacterized protein n=1 Tax=Modicisalibacter muralis TaxID=119000 RepID=A0A1G9QDU8_9GAMM|nr:hypothetical protein SAMN05661010_03344 [Halomonas muralis]